jgi:hypothetical protein
MMVSFFDKCVLTFLCAAVKLLSLAPFSVKFGVSAEGHGRKLCPSFFSRDASQPLVHAADLPKAEADAG